MTIREEAQRNHDALFPNHKSTLAETDPELIEVFDNRAFDEVLKDGVLFTRSRLMVQLAAIIACQAISEYRVMLAGALNVGVTPVEVKEIVYQAVPYARGARRWEPVGRQRSADVDQHAHTPPAVHRLSPRAQCTAGR